MLLPAKSQPRRSLEFALTNSLVADHVAGTGADAYATNNPAHVAPARVLLVEDNQFNQRLMLKAFSLLHCEAHIAENGVEALDRTSKGTHDVIFMDIRMPIMDGIDATIELRKRNVLVPIIGLTAAGALLSSLSPI